MSGFNPNNYYFHHSITGYTWRALSPLIDPTEGIEPKKLVYSAVLVIAGIIEMIVRSTFVLLAKPIHFFISKEHATNFDSNIMYPLVHHVKLTYFYTRIALNNLLNSSSARAQKAAFGIETAAKIFTPIGPGLIRQFIDLHIDGVAERPHISKETASAIRGVYIGAKNFFIAD